MSVSCNLFNILKHFKYVTGMLFFKLVFPTQCQQISDAIISLCFSLLKYIGRKRKVMFSTLNF